MGFEGTVEEWNNLYPIGTTVKYGANCRTRTRSAAIWDEGLKTVLLESVDDPVRLSELVPIGIPAMQHRIADTMSAEEWNRDHPIGTVVVWNNHINVTSTSAMNDGVVIVNLQGIDEPVLLSELTVSPENPSTIRLSSAARSRGASRSVAPSIGYNGHVAFGSPRRMAGGREDKANASIIMSAVELACLSRKMATHLLAINETNDNKDEAVRILALAASIEGVVGMGDPSGVKGTRAFFGDLVVGECYLTHFQGRSEDWSYAGVNNNDRMILIEVGGKQKIVASADYGLCAYDGGSGAWHPFVWTEKIGLNINDGRSVANMVDDEANLTEIEDEDNIF